MIYTVTFNPAVDYVMHLPSLKIGEINRSSCEKIYFGGKGINVSIVLGELGVKSKALGFIAGFTGEALEQGIKNSGADSDFIRLADGFTRINVKIKSGEETEINGGGPVIPKSAVDELLIKINKLRDGDMIVLAGSIPPSLPDDTYQKILDSLKDRNVKAVVDAENNLLLNALKYKPFLVKPNHHELGEMFGVRLNNADEIIKYAAKLKEAGAVNVLVSMAENGAVLIDEYGKIHNCAACKGVVKNSVGAGDSMIAGFVAGYKIYGNYDCALKLGTAAGGAAAFSNALPSRDEIYRAFEQLNNA